MRERAFYGRLLASLKPPKPAALLRIAGLLLLLTVLLPATTAPAGQLLSRQVPAAAKNLPSLGRLDGSKRLNLVIGLPLRHREALTNLLRDLYDPASPRYHQYLTAAQFAEQFGPTEKDYESVKQFAQAHGLTVTGTHPNRTLLDVNGAVADVEKTFHLHMHVYRHPTQARTFYAPDAEPSLDLDTPVLGISGLDDFVLPRPMNLKKADWNTTTNAPDFVTGSGPGGYFIGGDFRAAYAPGVALNGGGQSVGLFELDGYFPSDIANYETMAKLPSVALTNILIDNVTGAAGVDNDEVALDIDMAICMAPGLLQVMVYEGSTPDDVLNRMATDDQARQLSSSWGFGPQTDAVRDQIYEQYAAQGQTMFQASGDDGAYPGAIYPPSDDPNLTVVGGTSLTTSGPGGAWASEMAWSGSGGGISTTFAIPSWQQGVNMSANHGSTTMRNIPDVACLADVMIWLICNDGKQEPIGGTSAAAPLWAGFTALINQQASAKERPPVGFLNPALYAIGLGSDYDADFHDIVLGNNTNENPNDFFAVPGYDLCTGWGSPAGGNLINALATPPDALGIAPVTNVLVSGPAGGPFGPVGQNFVLTNNSTNSLNWALGSNASWLNLSPTGGTLAGGGSASVTVGFNSSANNLSAGNYAATVFFTDLNDGFSQNRGVTLDIVTTPIITRQPSSQTVPLGGTATFAVGTGANALLYFQWQDNGTNLTDGGAISGSATSTLVISNVSAANVGTYTVIVSNAANAITSAGAALAIASSEPVILTQPASQAVLQGATAIFTVAAAGNSPLAYQWQGNGTNLTDGGNVVGSGTSALTLLDALPANAGAYSVVVSNSLGSTASSNAALSIIPSTAPGAALSTLYSFSGGADGGNPNGLMQDTNGIFYGTTQNGGTDDSGTVFQITIDSGLTTLVLFDDIGSDAYTPGAALVQGPDGNLYGTTENGGTLGWGTVFRTTTNGALSTVANFNLYDGFTPASDLIVGSDGALYGAAAFSANSDGTVYRVTTNGTFTTLTTFYGADGNEPNALIQAANGSFYGTTFEGGANGNGTIFELATNGALTSLASFNYTNGGSLPYDSLLQTSDGNFYGTTFEGGAYGYGEVFEMSPLGEVTTLYSFTGQSDGAHPAAALILGTDGNFYGTTVYGGAFQDGTVFRLAPDGTLVSLAQFDGYDGANPVSRLVQGTDGNLYGTTFEGGTNNMGVVFQIALDFSTLQINSQPADQDAFVGADAYFSVAVAGNAPISYQWMENGTNLSDGAGISGSTTRVLTVLDATQASAGLYSVLVSNAAGTVLSDDAALAVIDSPPQIIVQPASQTTQVGGLATFSVTAIGDLPLTYQWQKNGTNLSDGGQITGSAMSSLTLSNLFETNNGIYSVVVSNSAGVVASSGAQLTVYAASVSGMTMAALYSFTGSSDGGIPSALMQASNGLFYGTTQTGGLYGDGTIFSLSTNGEVTTLLPFDGTNGATPMAGLTQSSEPGTFYGTTAYGGSNGAGTIFKVHPSGVLYTVYSFASNDDSANPFTPLTLDAAGDVYGAAQNNAAPTNGNIFELTTNGALTNLYFFTGGITGTMPEGGLAPGTDGNFYGMTGSNAEVTSVNGNIFKMTPAGQVTNLYSFTGSRDGFSPAGQLVLGDDGNFYGVTRFYHVSKSLFYGTIFKVTPGGTLTTLYGLNGFVTYTDGAVPDASLLHASDGNFYGVTLQGNYLDVNGTIYNNSYGTVFRITPSGTLTTLTSFNDSDDGAYPRTALVEGTDGCLYGTTSAGGLYGYGTLYRISFTSAPQINTQPASQTNVLGASAIFYVTVFGAPQLSYQWQLNGTNLADGGSVSGSAGRVLSLNNLTPAQAGTYSVIVSNALGTATSSGALLTIEAPPVFQSVTTANGMISFTWNATAGQLYQVQSATNLNSGWTNLGAAIRATNFSLGASDAIGSSGQKFYRIVFTP